MNIGVVVAGREVRIRASFSAGGVTAVHNMTAVPSSVIMYAGASVMGAVSSVVAVVHVLIGVWWLLLSGICLATGSMHRQVL